MHRVRRARHGTGAVLDHLDEPALLGSRHRVEVGHGLQDWEGHGCGERDELEHSTDRRLESFDPCLDELYQSPS